MSESEIQKEFFTLAERPHEHQIAIGNRSINYAEIGNDSLPVVVFVHGSPGSWSAFVDFMKDTTLLKQVKMVSVDRLGFGRSHLGKAEISLEQQARYLMPILKKYKHQGQKLIVVGHSLGGPVIARLAMDYPTLVDALVIVAGSIAPQLEPNERWFRLPLHFWPIRWLIPASFRASNTEILYLKPELEKMLPLWKNIHQPVIVIQGQKDNLVDPLNADFAQKMLVNSQEVKMVIVPDMNHFVPWEHPELIKNAILQVLKK